MKALLATLSVLTCLMGNQLPGNTHLRHQCGSVVVPEREVANCILQQKGVITATDPRYSTNCSIIENNGVSTYLVY